MTSIHHGLFALLAAAALATTAGAGVAQTAQSAAPTKVKIASSYISANGCHDTTQSFTAQIPNPERLDRTYHGALDGIEVIETAANGTHAYRNFAFVNGGRAVAYQLYAKGSGHWIDPPKVFGVSVGGGVCAGAAGASQGIDVWAILR